MDTKAKDGRTGPILSLLMRTEYLPDEFEDVIVQLKCHEDLFELFYKDCYQEKNPSFLSTRFPKVHQETPRHFSVLDRLAEGGILAFAGDRVDQHNDLKVIAYYCKLLENHYDQTE